MELDWIYGADRSPFRQEVAFNIGTSYHHKSFGGLQGFYISKPPPAHQKNRQNIVLRFWRHKIHERKDLLVATHAKQPLQNLLGTCEAKMIKNESSGKPIVPSPAIACVCVCGCALQKVNWVEQMDKRSTVYGMCFKRCIWLALPQIITSSNLHQFNIAMEFLPTYRWYDDDIYLLKWSCSITIQDVTGPQYRALETGTWRYHGSTAKLDVTSRGDQKQP